MKKTLSILMAVCLLFSLCGCTFLKDVTDFALNDEAVAKTFRFDGISIELTTDFLRMDSLKENYDFVVGTDTLSVLGLKMPDAETGLRDFTVREYAENFHSLVEELGPDEVTEIDGIPMFKYRDTDEDGEMTLALTFYRGSDCFWIIFFSAETENFDGFYSDICKYAKTVKCD